MNILIVLDIMIDHPDQVIVRLETEKYDLEERQKRQDYDVSNTFKATT